MNKRSDLPDSPDGLAKVRLALIGVLFLLSSMVGQAYAQEEGGELKLAIMQAKRHTAENFRPLETYLKTRDINIEFIAAANYYAAAQMFAAGRVNGMFSGSGVAGIMIIKDLAYPVLRPVGRNGHSTYRAVIIAPRGAPGFTGKASYFQGKKVICCPLASSGELFYRSLPGIDETGSTLLSAPSHGTAVVGLSRGAADVAIVKNWVWNDLKDQYPNLQKVGEDRGENPNGTLIISQKTDRQMVNRIIAALLALQDDPSPEARAVREKMGIQKYITTSSDDFGHTLDLLKRAGIDPSFNFEF